MMVDRKEPIDQVKDTETNGIIFVPIGHYALSDNPIHYQESSPNFAIYGLGSCIALILFDNIKKVSAMSHILLPKVNIDENEIVYPHKYANISVKLLFETLLNQGAMRDNIKALIVGGSRIFNLENNDMGSNNIHAVKKALNKLQIQIVSEDIGGPIGRNVIFDTHYFSLYVKTTQETDFNRIY
ncbi:MAG: chemotaxis protein CheD [Candidatus Thorarchaeota archaeon]